jgi:hypothetical protein
MSPILLSAWGSHAIKRDAMGWRGAAPRVARLLALQGCPSLANAELTRHYFQ